MVVICLVGEMLPVLTYHTGVQCLLSGKGSVLIN